ncbi:glycosyltransferase [Eubacteriaceae bacterium ES2]|nr:glycosyltransferase [Eubacteriaceae bacterium ES2]
MKVFLYSGMQKMIEKSGVGRAIYHQRSAAEKNGMTLVMSLDEAEVVHINTVFPKSLWIARQARKKGVAVVYHAHSTMEDFKNSFYGSNRFNRLFGKWIKICYNAGDLIVTPTPYAKGLLQSYGIEKKIEVVSNGIDLSYYNKQNVVDNKFRSKYGYLESDKIIMSVGLTIDRKGILDFVELARRMPDYKFIWFGQTNLNTVPSKIREAVQTELPNLKFAGYALKDQLREAYAGCDLFLFPSKEETEGIVVLEALGMKTPVLLRDIPVYQDWLVADQQVYKAQNIDEFEEKALKILNGQLPRLEDAGYQIVVERSLDKVGKKLAYIYQEAVALSRIVPHKSWHVGRKGHEQSL